MKRWWNWRRREKELEKEIQHHLRMAEEERAERGASVSEARAGARREFGNVGLAKELARDVWGWRCLEDLFEDARYGLRTLRNNPAFAAAAVLAIALGVGINVGIFSVLHGIALRLLPIPRAEQVVSVSQIFHGRVSRNVHGEGSMFSYPEYLDYRDHNHVFTGLVAYEPFVEASLAGGRTEQLLGTATSCNYFDVFKVRPALGRGLVESDCDEGVSGVVVISDKLWRGALSADAAIVGKRIRLNQTAYTVIGVMPPEFTGTELVESAFWAPVTMEKELEPGRDRPVDDNMSWLAMLGRVKPGVTTEEVRADLGVISGRIDQRHPGRHTALLVSTARFFGRPEERKVFVPIAAVVLAAFGLVLLIACANVSNLLLARASARHREIALRQSLGASRWRLVRQLVTESLLLSLTGGALGSLLALWSFAGIVRLVTAQMPRDFPTLAANVAPDFHVLAYAIGLTVVTGMAFGLIPALRTSKLDLNTSLKADGAFASSGKGSGRFLRHAFIAAQIAVCMILLVAAGLLLRGLQYAQTVDPGFEMKGLATTLVNLRSQGYDENRAAAFMASLRERVSAMPGVTEVALAESGPLSSDHSGDRFFVSGQSEPVGAEYNHVSPEYFSVVGIPIVRGRSFGPNDSRDGSRIIVTESTARKLWPGQDPLGKTLRARLTGGLAGPEYVVIGVARDAQVSRLGEFDTTYLYFPAAPRDSVRAYLLVRFAGNFTDVANGLHAAARSLDADVPVEVSRLEDNLEVWRAPSRIASALSGALGGLALLLASIGVYGMVSYTVSRSVREIGIRMALGAKGSNVMRQMLGQAMRPVLVGGLIGVAGCAAVSWVLSSMLFGMSAHDPVAFAAATSFLVLVAFVASYIPARRAVSIDPVVALRYE